ncbi:unnamed protein product, partial [Prunus brigantina]
QGVGLIVRDLHGVLIRPMTIRTPSLMFVLTTKLYALKVGLSFALDASLMPVVVEYDYLVAMQLLSNEEKCLAPEGVLVTKIWHLLLALSSSVRFVPRTTNIVAHRIARYRLVVPPLHILLGNSKRVIASHQLNHSVSLAKHEPNAT